MSGRFGVALGLVLALVPVAGCDGGEATTPPPRREHAELVATAETEPVPNRGDAADDPAIWIDPADPARSTIIGTDKKGGLAVYDLSGRQLQYLADGGMNNVDLRSDFALGGERVTLVASSSRRDDALAIYRVDPETRTLVAAARPIRLEISAYGLCMYRSPRTGDYYAFVNSEKGEVEQWLLVDAGGGEVGARRVRQFDVGKQTEGCVADDELGHLYIGEEVRGIWRYGAEPSAPDERTLVDETGAGGHLEPDVEGLTLSYGPDGTGYLIASSQGNSTFVVYRREGSNEYVGTFTIVSGAGIDRVQGTDGIDVTTARLGPDYPTGLFVAQDDKNDREHQNFKLVPWRPESWPG